jgi:protein tyrosine phosphatase
VIHCSAGLGRSGVICVLYKIIKNIKESKYFWISKKNEGISIWSSTK